jgi:hypothetical protein
MKNLYTSIFILLFSATFGYAQMVDYKINHSFSKFSNDSKFDVFLEKGDEESVKVVFIQNIEKGDIIAEVVGNTLEIRQTKANLKKAKAKIYITYKYLDGITNHGEGNINVLSDVHTKMFEIRNDGPGSIRLNLFAGQLDAKISGPGNVEINGQILSQYISIEGEGNYRAYSLESKDTDIKIYGKGNAEVQVNQLLTASVSGQGNVFYKGDPNIFDAADFKADNIQRVFK